MFSGVTSSVRSPSHTKMMTLRAADPASCCGAPRSPPDPSTRNGKPLKKTRFLIFMVVLVSQLRKLLNARGHLWITLIARQQVRRVVRPRERTAFSQLLGTPQMASGTDKGDATPQPCEGQVNPANALIPRSPRESILSRTLFCGMPDSGRSPQCQLSEKSDDGSGSNCDLRQSGSSRQQETFNSDPNISRKQSPAGGRTMVGLSLVDKLIEL